MIKVIDNFLDDVDKIRQYALNLDYYPPTSSDYWVGFRTGSLENLDDDINILIKNKILNCLENNCALHKSNIILESAFHYSPSSTQKMYGDLFEKLKFHVDYSANYAGVWYLYPNPPKNSGTSFRNRNKTRHIENVYNRLLLYDAKIPHAPTNFFGEDVTDSRLTYVFFAEKKQIEEIFASNTTNIFNIK